MKNLNLKYYFKDQDRTVTLNVTPSNLQHITELKSFLIDFELLGVRASADELDGNSFEIFQGDILEFNLKPRLFLKPKPKVDVVKWKTNISTDAALHKEFMCGKYTLSEVIESGCIVIGNEIQNPGLLGKNK